MILFVLIFILICGPILQTSLSYFADTSLIEAGLMSILFVFFYQSIDKKTYNLLMLLVLISSLAWLSTILLNREINSITYTGLLRPIKMVIILLGSYFIIKKVAVNHSNTGEVIYYKILKLIYISIVMHGLIIIAQFFFPSFRDLTYQLLIDMDVLEYNKKFRMPGLAGAGGAQVGAVQGLGFLIGAHLILFKKNAFIPYITNALLIMSIIFTGRTGFILVIISLFYWIYINFFVLKSKKIKTIKAIILSCFFISLIFTVFSNVFKDDLFFDVAVNRSFKTYNNYKETEKFEDETLVTLSQMIDIPQSLSTFLIGDLKQFDNTLGQYYSDIGYIRLWWSYGIIGLFEIISLYILIGYYISRPEVINTMGKHNVNFGLLLLLSLFILNTKEVFFFTRMTNPIIILSTMSLYWITVEKRRSFFLSESYA